MKRNVYVGVIFAALLGALAIASLFLQKQAAVEAAGVRPRGSKSILVAEAAAESLDSRPDYRRIGRCPGPRLDHPPRRLARTREVHATTNPPIAQCCAPAPPVLQFDQEGNLISSWGGPGTRIRLAGLESRRHGRLQRQRVDRRERRGTPPARQLEPADSARRCARRAARGPDEPGAE